MADDPLGPAPTLFDLLEEVAGAVRILEAASLGWADGAVAVKQAMQAVHLNPSQSMTLYQGTGLCAFR